MSSDVSAALTITEINEITLYINTYRAKNQAPPLIWNNTIADFSRQWSHHLMTDNLFQHSGTTLYGENLASFQGMGQRDEVLQQLSPEQAPLARDFGTDKLALLKQSVDNWYAEISLYDFSRPGFSSATGHFTCLVWLSSSEYGIAIDSSNNRAIVTMNTSPPGNMEGQFPQNVLPHIIDSSNVLVPLPLPYVPTDISSATTIPTLPLGILNPIKTQSQNMIGMIRGVIYSIQTKKPTYYLLYQVRSIKNYAAASQIPISKQIVSILQTIITAVQNRATHHYLYSLLQYVIVLLQPYTPT